MDFAAFARLWATAEKFLSTLGWGIRVFADGCDLIRVTSKGICMVLIEFTLRSAELRRFEVVERWREGEGLTITDGSNELLACQASVLY